MTGVVVNHDGAQETLTADLFVVACGAANSARLLLMSANEQHPNGLANGSGQVGRNYMFHNSQAVLALSLEENPTVFQKTLGLNDFYLRGPDFDFPMGNIQMVGKSQAPMFRGEKPGETRFAPTWSLEDVALHAVDFWLSTEDLPRAENRVTVDDKGMITIAYTATNDEPKQRLFEQLKSMLGDLGMHHHHLLPHTRLPQERDPGGRRRAPGRHLPVRHRRRARPCSTPTARRTSSTTSTWPTRASSPASARSTRRSPRWPTRCASATICSSGWESAQTVMRQY